jgi:hypothetical protein
MSTALGLVPINILIFNTCFICLKKISISHLALYSCEIVSAVQDVLLVMKVISAYLSGS